MTTSDQEEQAERRRVTLQDADRRRQQASTNLDHALAAANDISGGRFGATGTRRTSSAQQKSRTRR